MVERRLASIQVVAQVEPIKRADRIEAIRINGWWVVTRKNEYAVGDKVVYFEVDSWVPHTLAPFLSKGKEPRVYQGVPGERLRTMRIRGELSQGLLLTLSEAGLVTEDSLDEGSDVTKLLNVTKWERVVPKHLRGLMKGTFPNFVPKTTLARIQNLSCLPDPHRAGVVEVTEKLDGSSMTVYHFAGVVGVCSRNVDLKLDQKGNAFVDMFKSFTERQMEWLKHHNIALQGELVGGNIQGNSYGIEGYKYFIFNMYDIDAQEYLPPRKTQTLAEALGFDYVPIIQMDTLPVTMKEYRAVAEGQSALGSTQREGLVFKPTNGRAFKVLSIEWLFGTGN